MPPMLSKQKLLIGAGVEKCGTTSLFALLDKTPGFVTPSRKETRFFGQHYRQGLDYYLQLFGIPDDRQNTGENPQDDVEAPGPDDWLVDISPAYFRSHHAYDRILANEPEEIVAVFLIRNPVRRAFSQYWHDIFNHVTRAQGGWGKEFRNFSFLELARQRNSYYFTRYARAVQRFRETFGANGIVALFEELVGDPAPFVQTLSDKTGVPIPEPEALPRSNESSFARFELASSGVLERVGVHKRIPLRVDQETARNLLAIQGTFTHFLTVEQCEEIHQTIFARDIAALEEIMGRPLDALKEQRPLASPLWKQVARAGV